VPGHREGEAAHAHQDNRLGKCAAEARLSRWPRRRFGRDVAVRPTMKCRAMRLASIQFLILALAVTVVPHIPALAAGISADVSNCLVKPRRVIQLGSPVFGALSNVYVDRGDVVKKDQVLARLNSTVEEMQVALDKFRATNTTQIEAAKVDLAWNQRELDRRRQLAGNMFSKANDIDEYITKVDQDQLAIRKAQADLETAKLEAARSDAQLQLKILTSPVNGVVTEIKLSPGEFIYEQTPIMTLAEVDPLNIDLVVPAEVYHSVKIGAIGEVHLNPPVDATFPARVDVIDPVIDAASDTFRIRLILPNPGNAIPAGIKCSVRLPDAGTGE
jgi:RND family efflux transporter MFP subunit